MKNKSRWVYLMIFFTGVIASLGYLLSRPVEQEITLMKNFSVMIPVEPKPWFKEPAWWSLGLASLGFLWTVIKDFLPVGRKGR